MTFSYHSISIAPDQGQPHLSKAQKAFNSLIKQLDKKRALLMAWESAIPVFQQKYTGELAPLLDASADMQVKMVHGLDLLYSQKGLSKTERRTVADLIVDLAGALLAERDDDELKAVFNKYHHVDYDSQEAAELAQMKDLFEGMTGLDLGDDVDLRSPEDVMRHIHAQFEEEEAARQAVENDVHAIGVSTLAAGHKTLVPALVKALQDQGAGEIVVFVGGVVPAQDYEFLYQAGAKGIFGPGTPIPQCARDVLQAIAAARAARKTPGA